MVRVNDEGAQPNEGRLSNRRVRGVGMGTVQFRRLPQDRMPAPSQIAHGSPLSSAPVPRQYEHDRRWSNRAVRMSTSSSSSLMAATVTQAPPDRSPGTSGAVRWYAGPEGGVGSVAPLPVSVGMSPLVPLGVRSPLGAEHVSSFSRAGSARGTSKCRVATTDRLRR